MNQNIKRIGIYLIYDKEGIIDEYIPFLLESVMSELSRLIVVCNGELNEQGRRRLRGITKELYACL